MRRACDGPHRTANSTLGATATFNPANPTLWQRPTSIMQARLFKISVQFDF